MYRTYANEPEGPTYIYTGTAVHRINKATESLDPDQRSLVGLLSTSMELRCGVFECITL